MHTKLIGKSDKRTKVATDIRDSILHDPQSPVCQELLDQLKEVNNNNYGLPDILHLVKFVDILLIHKSSQ